MTKKILVIGGGIAGLTAANVLQQRGAEVILLERTRRVGGCVETFCHDGFMAEGGPNSFIAEDKELYDFLRSSGVMDYAVDVSPAAKKRYILRGAKPRAVPASVAAAVFTPLFSFCGKLRLLAEPFIRSRSKGEETVADFVRRRIGREMYDYALNPLVAGVFAGDPEKLAVRYAFPKVWNLEQKYGSLIMGTFPNAKAKRLSGLYEKKRTMSFPEGMETLPKILAKNLGTSVRLNATITELVREGRQWRARWFTCGSVCDFFEQDGLFDDVVFALPPRSWDTLKGVDPDLSEKLASAPQLYSPPVTTLTLGYAKSDVGHPLDGFGMLVPAKENRQILGSLWTSSFLDGRAPQGFVTLTNYVGGSRQPGIAEVPPEEQLAIVKKELLELLGVKGDPVFVKICQHEHAIPQYNTGYGDFMSLLCKIESDFPGIHFCGNYRGGIAVGATLLNAVRCAKKI